MIVKKKITAGFTLVELLVVIVILLLLVTVVLPLAQPAPGKRVVREAARQVNSFFSVAQAKAVATGRPHGVLIAPSQSNSTRSFQLFQTKVALPYSGDFSTWRVRIAQRDDIGFGNDPPEPNIIKTPNDPETGEPPPPWDQFRGRLEFFSIEEPTTVLQPTVLLNSVSDGQTLRIRLKHQGAYYYGGYEQSNFYISLPTRDPPPGTDETEGSTIGLPFQIQRPPQKSAAAPLELPVGSYIDLEVSGTDESATFAGDTFVTFDASGRLLNEDGVFLLIGSDSSPQIGAPFQYLTNIIKGVSSAWVMINRNRVNTTDNLGLTVNTSSLTINGGTPYANQNDLKLGAIQMSRDSARSGPALGGR